MLAVAGASKLGWMGDIENSDYENAHAVGMLGRMDPSYARSERVRSQAKLLAAGASEMEGFFEKVISAASMNSSAVQRTFIAPSSTKQKGCIL